MLALADLDEVAVACSTAVFACIREYRSYSAPYEHELRKEFSYRRGTRRGRVGYG